MPQSMAIRHIYNTRASARQAGRGSGKYMMSGYGADGAEEYISFRASVHRHAENTQRQAGAAGAR